ncbi:cellulase family glycosylhydrolase [Geminisphaera colitermitum]|uniref:cellulase family glycosylhydrolase n=1 Tax=Geminisphaera colitermitum TaxID=1148786 RepID=UPI0005B7F2BB|nr:cellulase family glycosylhydrolase [Geminisphaera colitermitum]
MSRIKSRITSATIGVILFFGMPFGLAAATEYVPISDFYTDKNAIVAVDNRLLVSATHRAYLLFEPGVAAADIEQATLKMHLVHHKDNCPEPRDITVSAISAEAMKDIPETAASIGRGFAPPPLSGVPSATLTVDGSQDSRYWETDVTGLIRAQLSGEGNPSTGGFAFMLARTSDARQGAPLRFTDRDPRNDSSSARLGKPPVLLIRKKNDIGPTAVSAINLESDFPLPISMPFGNGDVATTPRLRGFTVRFDADEKTFRDARALGANSVRLMLSPITTHASNPVGAWQKMLERLPSQLEAARENGIFVVVSLFSPPMGNYRELRAAGKNAWAHYLWREPGELELMKKQAVETARLIKPFAGHVWLELKNEPLDWDDFPSYPQNWPDWAQRLINAVREISDVPIVVQVGPGGLCWGFATFPVLQGDNIVYSVHNYQPHAYTHQGVKNLEGTDLKQAYEKIKQPWPGQFGDSGGGVWDAARLRKELAPAIEFARKNKARIYVGEFGVARWAPDAAQYLRDNIELFEELGWDWTYHAFRESHIWSFEHNEEYSTYHDARRADSMNDRGKILRQYLSRNAQ